MVTQTKCDFPNCNKITEGGYLKIGYDNFFDICVYHLKQITDNYELKRDE